MEGQARSPRQKLYPCNRLLGRTHLGGLVCISRSSNSAFWVAVVRSRWVMLWTRSLPAASGMSHPSYRLACRVLQRSGYVLTTNGVEQHQVGGEPSFLPRCRQLVPRLFIRCNKLSPEICFRVEAPNSMLQVKISAAPVRLRPREHRGRRSASRRICGWRRIALSLSHATLLSVEALLHQDGCEKDSSNAATRMVLGVPLHCGGNGQAKHGSPNNPATLSSLSTTLQSLYDVDVLVLPPLLPDSGIGTHVSGFRFSGLASCCLSVCLLAFECVQCSRLKQA